MHLLAETAISDSMQFEVLSFEEVDELKKELLLLTNRIEASKRKLALELKLQEAAFSLSRLYDSRGSRRESLDSSPESSPKSHRRRLSLFGRHSLQHRSDEELSLSVRRCEEIAQELWKLERRAGDIRRRILEHTAGILQMTHKGLKKKSANRPDRNGDIAEFDERSLYRTPDYLDDFNGGHTPRDLPAVFAGQRSSVSFAALNDAKRRLDDLNVRLREMISQANPDQDIDHLRENVNGAPADPIIAVQSGLDALDKGLKSIASQRTVPQQKASNSNPDIEEKLDSFNKRLDAALIIAGSTRPQLTPRTSTFRKTLADQVEYLGQVVADVEVRVGNLTEQKTILTTQIQQQRELNCKSDAERDAHAADLTEQIVKLQKELERSQREAGGMREELAIVMDQLDAARQESMVREQQNAADEASSVNADREARQRVEELLALKEDEIFRSQEALQKAEEALAQREDEVNRSQEARQRAEESMALKDNEIALLEETRQKFAQELERVERSLATKEDEIVNLKDLLNKARDDLASMEQKQAEKESQIASLQATLQQLQSQKDAEVESIRQSNENAKAELQKLQSEYSELEGEVVRIQTELTIAQAELDGAYGSRAERAARVAANPAIQKEMDELNQRNMSLIEELAILKEQQPNKNNAGIAELQERVQMLEKELRETIDDYEALTKASIEFEKERDKLEGIIDSYRERCENVEAQLNDERIQSLGANGARRGDGTPTESTSMMVLKNEFKKMMRDTRAENMKALKVCLSKPYISIQQGYADIFNCRPNKKSGAGSNCYFDPSKRSSTHLENRI